MITRSSQTLFYDSYSFSYDLEELADYYIAYRRMMAHWHAVMPGAILDVRYEDLVADPRGQGKRLFDWCGLAWDPAVLDAPTDDKVFATASAAQVREPVHNRSVRSGPQSLHGQRRSAANADKQANLDIQSLRNVHLRSRPPTAPMPTVRLKHAALAHLTVNKQDTHSTSENTNDHSDCDQQDAVVDLAK